MAGDLLTLAPSRAASLQELKSIRTPGDVPDGAVFVCPLSHAARFTLPFRWGWQTHWLREIASGMVEGLAGVRADASAEARLDAEWQDSFLARVSLEEGRLRLQILKDTSTGVSLQGILRAGVSFDHPLAKDPSALLSALTGQNSFALIRSIFADTGSQRWSEFASSAGIRTRILEDLADRWARLSPRVEPALYDLAANTLALKEVREWCARILNDLPNADALQRLAADWPWEKLPGGTAMLDLLEAAAGAPLDSVLPEQDWTRLRGIAAEIQALLTQERLAAALNLLTQRAGQAGAAWIEERLNDLGAAGLNQLTSLVRNLMERAPAILEKKLTAELSLRASLANRDSALLDARFDFSNPGLTAFRRVLSGDWQPAITGESQDVEVLHAVLSHQRRRRFDIELHLPFATRKNWEFLTQSLASLEIVTGPAGRTLVLSAEALNSSEAVLRHHSVLSVAGSLTLRGIAEPQPTFRIAFEDRRTVCPGDPAQPYYAVLRAYGLDQKAHNWIEAASSPVEATLGVHAPGELFSAWATIPSERELSFFDAFRPVSVAVQGTLRTWLPACWFADLDHYDDLGAAFPLVIYAASNPFSGRPRASFTYDAMDDSLVDLAFRSAARGLKSKLAVIQARLVAAGKTRTADFYDPEQAGRILADVRRRQLFDALLIADAAFVNQLADLASAGRELRGLVQRDPSKAARDLGKFAEKFVAAFRKRLRRLYAGAAFEALGSLLLVEATAALTGCGRLPLQATLHLRCKDREITLA